MKVHQPRTRNTGIYALLIGIDCDQKNKDETKCDLENVMCGVTILWKCSALLFAWANRCD